MSAFKGSNSAKFVGRGNDYSSQASSFAQVAQQLLNSQKVDEIDDMMGFPRFIPSPALSDSKIGWLSNMHPTIISQEMLNDGSNSHLTTVTGVSGVDFYFIDEEGGSFKTTLTYDPYFFVSCTDESRVHDIEEFLKKTLEHCIKKVELVLKDDLAMNNHLVGLKKYLLKLTFSNSNQLFEARRILRPILKVNEEENGKKDIYNAGSDSATRDVKTLIEDIREYDVPYHVRVSIDKNIRVGKWYKVSAQEFAELEDKVTFADPVVLAFDIETTKAPLKFPDSAIDQIMMISYMIDGEGFLITNREIISEDIEDFEYTPKDEYKGQFAIFNEADETALLQRFFEHIRDVRPTVISTFNGDFFDWPFVENRAKFHGLNMFDEIGFAPDAEGEYKSSYCTHMDCFRWVKRDSYLPQGSQGLKAVTQAKLGYNPIELDPELMTPYAYEKPQVLSEYSVSDAVATYYLYMKYVHPFIFSLCTIIPLNPDEVLRKGTGTLCEMLLMVQAYNKSVLLPNKHTDPIERFYDGHLLESETYVGGHVESLEAGVFRSDLKNDFKIDPTVIDILLEDLPHALEFCVTVENNGKMEDVTNFDEIKEEITAKLIDLKINNKRNELPLIYHVDVASMYPNIMTTNRLQPDSMKDEKDCASCDFNRPGKSCDRRLKWAWRGEFFPAKMDEYGMVKRALQNELFPNKNPKSKKQFLTFEEVSYADQVVHIKKRLTDYSRKVYHRVKVTETVEREAIVCQRENPFYVNTVRSFRDRRYEFKGLAKVWKGKLSKIDSDDTHAKDEAKKMIVLYDSLQLAHKVILNSFYGYVMRKGSRWYSMEMAGITCLTGANIIQMARSLVERIGRPLELDTDGIWCILPKSFPENFEFKLKNGKKLYLSYPCSMLNYKVHQQYTNHQYQDLVDPERFKYQTKSDNSIFFEVDGPYKAMILPTSKEEGKGIKKRYAVFNDDGSLAELKGFELKRRGELQLIKNFQSDIFKLFLEGTTLESCYAAVATVANRWLDVLDSRGAMLETEDLIELICENKSMSKTLKEYQGQKSTSITTAKRLGEFLGEAMVKDAGLQCKFIISSKPYNAPVTERAIPVAIFSSDLHIKRTFLRRWLLDSTLNDFDPRAIIDWEYYRERLASVVQKIITIPAALQNIKNPVPRVEHPDWLRKKIAISEDTFKQSSLNRFFKKTKAPPQVRDIEDSFNDPTVSRPLIAKVTAKRKNKRRNGSSTFEEESLTLPSEMPSMLDDYIGWLEYQKIKWKIQHIDRKKREKLFGKSSRASDRSALGNLIRKHVESYADKNWEILQCKPSIDLGVVDVYALINRKVQLLKINIPKSILINFKTETFPCGGIENCEVEKSSAQLPNVKSINNENTSQLFKLTMSEDTYQNETNKASSVLNNENVLGIYESSISSNERVIMQLGTCVQFSSEKMGALGQGLQNGFHMNNLHPAESERYLQRFDLNIAYLLHFVTDIGYEFYFLFKPWENVVEVFALKPSGHAQEITNKSIESLYNEIYDKKFEKLDKYYDLIKLNKNVSFGINNFTESKRLLNTLSKYLQNIKEEQGSQTIMILQSPYTHKVTKLLQTLNSFPMVEISTAETHLPPLNWQSQLMRKAVNHILSLGSWVSNLITLSKYSNIPICNLKVDNMGYIIDLMYARQLKKNNIVLWWNDKSPLPDHGGVEKDFDPRKAELMNDLTFPTMNNPDIYDDVVLEISVYNSVVNTVLSSTILNEAEGTDLAQNSTSKDGSFGFVEDSFSSSALSVLRTLLKELWDHALADNITADSLLHAFIGWVYSPDAKLFDYALRYHVHTLTQKAMLQLINEFKLAGSSLIFSDRNKLLIKTQKHSVENSYAYGQYLMKAIRSKPMFAYLDLKIDRYWDVLVWMDKHNYGGRACLQIEERETQKFQAYSHWHIKEFLPIIYQQEFDDWLVVILDNMVKVKESYYEQNSLTQRLTQLPQNKLSDRKSDNQTDSLGGFTNAFAKPLIKRMGKLYKNQQEYILDPNFGKDYICPTLPGSHLIVRNPLLELVKYLSHILLLSSNHLIEGRALRKELLKIFEMREFDRLAEFKNPSTSFIIPSFICEHCSYILDIDICRENMNRVFTCQNCSRSLNKSLMEEHVIERLQALITAFIIQDVTCTKCRKIKEDAMSPYCQCSGRWELATSKEKFLAQLQVFKNLSESFEFATLKETLNELF
ncbi:unnamed protein product [Kluyveromyces dobzhanskii CBS 2104]|uniref:DNA polymerase epsilon catalytic subunit n=1 Tax=Kluyveromyces dobzhanskii CBS 2104 TaxID=1427455 RepID=A0A0A8L3M5_9SACH|nr:unnamed protein product [Kluyveromyces dobzhanskii CBS 2104]